MIYVIGSFSHLCFTTRWKKLVLGKGLILILNPLTHLATILANRLPGSVKTVTKLSPSIIFIFSNKGHHMLARISMNSSRQMWSPIYWSKFFNLQDWLGILLTVTAPSNDFAIVLGAHLQSDEKFIPWPYSIVGQCKVSLHWNVWVASDVIWTKFHACLPLELFPSFFPVRPCLHRNLCHWHKCHVSLQCM